MYLFFFFQGIPGKKEFGGGGGGGDRKQKAIYF